MTTLSPGLLQQILQVRLGSGYHRDVVDMLWPGIDVNKMTTGPGADGRHLLLYAIGSHNRPEQYDSFIFDKITSDPRLDLPEELLTEAYSLGVQKYLKSRYTSPNPVIITTLKNFNPNAKVKRDMLITHVVKTCIDPDGPNWFDMINRDKMYPLVEAIINHERFDPYIDYVYPSGLTHTFAVVQCLHSDIGEDSGNKQVFKDGVIDRLKVALKKPVPPILRRLENVFKNKIPAEQLHKDHGLEGALFMAAACNLLPHFMAVGKWSQNLGDVVAYETALAQLPELLREQYADQLKQCEDNLSQRRVQINRPAGNVTPEFLKRLAKGTGNAERGIV